MLTGKQRSYLRGKGNSLDPVVHIGKDGITESQIKQLDQALDDHELIKVRVLDNSGMGTRSVASKFAEKCNAEIVQVIGSVVLIYRENPEEAIYKLPD